MATQVKKIFIDTLLVQTWHTLASPNLPTMDEVQWLQCLRAEKGNMIAKLALTRLHVQPLGLRAGRGRRGASLVGRYDDRLCAGVVHGEHTFHLRCGAHGVGLGSGAAVQWYSGEEP